MEQALAVAAKAPQPGAVKTRLHSLLSPEAATELYRCFLRDTIALVERVPATDPFISYTPAGSEHLFEGIVSNGLPLLAQRGATFGDRLYNALDDLLGLGYHNVAIMDADSPTVPGEYLARAFEELARPGDRVVLGPASDGGYYLIGIKQRHRALFQGISWSTATVLQETINRARELSLEVALLPEWFDVDNVTDLQRLWREIRDSRTPSNSANGQQQAINTRRFLLSRWPQTMPEPQNGN